MDKNYLISQLNIEEQFIYDNVVKTLKLKHIDIDRSIIIDCIVLESKTNTNRIDIESKLLGLEYIIKKCIDTQLKRTKIINNNEECGENLNKNNIDKINTIIKNEINTLNNKELREEYIYIKGVSGEKYKYTNTYLLNKTFNNVESIELIGGYINDNPYSLNSSIIGDGPQESDIADIGIIKDTQEIFGSIGPIPFIWIDIDNFDTKLYNHYTNISVSGINDNCSNCNNNVDCIQCEQSSKIYLDSVPQGSFFVQLKQYNFLDHYFKGGATNTSSVSGVGAKNIVYIINRKTKYIKTFNTLISIDKLRINIRNIVGKPLWGCDNNRAEKDEFKKNTSEQDMETNLLRWELIFKVKYYIHKIDNTFLLQNS